MSRILNLLASSDPVPVSSDPEWADYNIGEQRLLDKCEGDKEKLLFLYRRVKGRVAKISNARGEVLVVLAASGPCVAAEKQALQSDLLRTNGNYGKGTLLRSNNLLVGETRAVGSIFEVGEVHYYTRASASSDFVRQSGFFAGTQQSGQAFGSSIASSATMEKVVVGSPTPDTGDVWVYDRAAAVFTLDQEISPNTATNSGATFGADVAMDSSGVHILIGAPNQDTGAGGADGGLVEYWEDVAGTWTFRQAFASGLAYTGVQRFGQGVTMSSSTEAYIAKTSSSTLTTVERWTRAGTTWSYQDSWTLPYGSSSAAVGALKMDFNGTNRLIFGYSIHDGTVNDGGLVVITDLSGNVISEIEGDTLGTEFGSGVTIDGSEAVIGEWRADPTAVLNAGVAGVWDVCV